MKVKIIYENTSEEFEDVKQYTNINNDKRFLGLVMNNCNVIYINKKEIERIEIIKKED